MSLPSFSACWVLVTLCVAACGDGGASATKPSPKDVTAATRAQDAPATGGSSHNPAEELTEVQTKLDSHLVLALKQSRKEPPFDQPTKLDPDVVFEADGRVLVDLKATVSTALLARIEQLGGSVVNSFATAHAIRAHVPLNCLETLASRDDVLFIAPAAEATTNSGSTAQPAIIQPQTIPPPKL